MKKSNLGYAMAIILMSSILIVESGFASITTLMNGNTNAFNNSNDTIAIKGRNYINKNISLPKPVDGTDLTTSLERLIQYPEAASSSYVNGLVEVLCTIEKNGLVSDVIILQGDDSNLVNEVVKAVRSVKFKPAMQNGFPVKYRMIIPVKFDLASR